MSIEMTMRMFRKIFMDSEKRYSSMWYLKTESGRGHSVFLKKKKILSNNLEKIFICGIIGTQHDGVLIEKLIPKK
jgi:hypothetical protein